MTFLTERKWWNWWSVQSKVTHEWHQGFHLAFSFDHHALEDQLSCQKELRLPVKTTWVCHPGNRSSSLSQAIIWLQLWPSSLFKKKIFIGCAGPLLCTGFSLVVVSRGHSLLPCVGFLLWWSLLLCAQAVGARASVGAVPGLYSTGSTVVVHELTCPPAMGPSWTRDGNCVSCIVRQILYHKAPGKPLTIILIEPHERICIGSTT